MVAILDYGVGNLFSLKSSLAYLKIPAVVTRDPEIISRCDRLILPGVGAFGDAAEKLRSTGLDTVAKNEARSGKPLLGICLGMQLLFDESNEFGEHEGLGLIPGVVRPIADRIPGNYTVPHIGWNSLHFPTDKPRSPLFSSLNEGDCVYFVHSFAAEECETSVSATVEYGAELTAAVESGNVFGTQFHPEKSGPVGLKILKAFCEV